MNSYKGKLLFLLSLFFIYFIICFSVRELNDVMQKNNISDQQITDNQAFLNTFSGEWKTADAANKLTFSEHKQIITISFPTENRKVNVSVSSQQPARKRWLLSPMNSEETQYSVILLSDDELSFQMSTTKPNAEGTSKPEHFYRIK